MLLIPPAPWFITLPRNHGPIKLLDHLMACEHLESPAKEQQATIGCSSVMTHNHVMINGGSQNYCLAKKNNNSLISQQMCEFKNQNSPDKRN